MIQSAKKRKSVVLIYGENAVMATGVMQSIVVSMLYGPFKWAIFAVIFRAIYSCAGCERYISGVRTLLQKKPEIEGARERQSTHCYRSNVARADK